MDAPEVCTLTLRAWRWIENITPHPKSYAANYFKRHTLRGWSLNLEFGGMCRIQGTVKINEVLACRRVTLLRRRDLRVVAQTWSDAETGEYAFEYIKADDYMVVCDDYRQAYNAAIADYVELTAAS